MKSLVIVSQKGGVGKTTSSVNIAAALGRKKRVLLIDTDPIGSVCASLSSQVSLGSAGAQLSDGEGFLSISGENFDVFVPNEEDELTLDRFSSVYDWVVIDSQPYSGSQSNRIIRAASEMIVVMRGDALCFRSLPAFLEVLKSASANGESAKLRGVLLTLPSGEEPGGQWETALRRRLGSLLLPCAIPHDELIYQALIDQKSAVHAFPNGPASRQYQELARILDD